MGRRRMLKSESAVKATFGFRACPARPTPVPSDPPPSYLAVDLGSISNIMLYVVVCVYIFLI